MRLLSRVLVFSILITSITSLNSPSASAATVVSFEDLSSCPDEYLDKIPVGKQIQKCIFTGTELLFVNKFPKSKASTNIKIYFETTMIKETSAENLSLAFDKPGQYNFVIDAIDQSVKNENLLSEIFYVLEPPAVSSNSKMAGATSISEQKQSYLLTYSDSSIIQTLENDYGFVPLTKSSLNTNVPREGNILIFPESSNLTALGTVRVSLTTSQASLLKSDKRILVVEKNEIRRIQDTQSSAPWNLDRIDQASLPLDNTFTYPASTFVPTVYVLDSGLRYYHEDFGNRVKACLYFTYLASTCDDYYGHGTHVTGTVAGTKSGAAKNAQITFLKITENYGGRTSLDYIYSAFDFAIDHHIATDPNHQAVLNLSFGGDSMNYSSTIYWMAAMTAAKIIPVVAAGNEALNSCYYDFGYVGSNPYDYGVSVGATDRTDKVAYFSNYGPCVTIYAPGVEIVSASYLGNSSYLSYNGTSMASPLVAGALANFISVHPSATRVDAIDWLLATSRKNIISGMNSSSNNLLLSLIPSIFAPSLVITNSKKTIAANEVVALNVNNPHGGPITYTVTGSGCLISGANLSANKETTCSVVANKEQVGYIAKLTSAAVTFTVTGIAQETLTISNTATTGPAGTPITLTASGGSGTGAVSYATTTTGCSVSGVLLNATALTTCVVTASKAASGIYGKQTSAPVNFAFTIANQAALVISNASKSGIAGTPITLTTTGGSGAGAVSYATASDGCSITGALLTTTQPTTCVVSATKAANGIYASVTSATASFILAAAAQSVLTISNVTKTAIAGNVITLSSTGGSGAGAVSYATATDGCVISDLALTTTKPTTCLVSATKAANGIYASATSAAVSFTFTAAIQANFSISNSSKTGVVGTPITLTTSGGNGDGEVSYKTTSSGCTVVGSQLSSSLAVTCVVIATKASNGVWASTSSAPVQFVFRV